MENNKIFLTINRVNSVLFMVLLIASLIGAVFIFQDIQTSPRRNVVEITASDKDTEEIIELSDINTIRDKGIQYIRVYSRGAGMLKSGNRRTLRNLLFLSQAGKEATWLLPDNRSEIRIHRVLNTYDDETKKSTSDYLYVEVNPQSGGLSACVSKPDGTELNCLETSLSKILQFEYFSDNKTLGLLVQVANEIRYKVFDLKSMTLDLDKFVIKL